VGRVAAACALAVLGAAPLSLAVGVELELRVEQRVVNSSGATVGVSGVLRSGRGGQLVSILARDCAADAFRIVGGTQTEPGGSFTTRVAIEGTTLLRARVGATTSPAVQVLGRIPVWIATRGRTVDVGVQPRHARVVLAAKPVALERFDRTRGRWVVIRRTKLARGTFGSYNATFRRVQRGLVVRASFASRHARPCYVGGVSRVVTT
jgi:hypothetical protein